MSYDSEPVTSRHLWQAPRYQAANGPWRETFLEAVDDAGPQLTWDVGALLAIIGLNYPLGDRTLFREIRRQPWLSRMEADSSVAYEPLPPHDHYWLEPEQIAEKLHNRLLEEGRRLAATGAPLYLLLSGGLDSRIAAGILAELQQEGTLTTPVHGVTWGVENCRDVAYGRQVAERLGFTWQRLDLQPADLLRNVNDTIALTAGLVSPFHIHRMDWFAHAPANARVVAASYGDSIGRAEFSGLHILDLPHLHPVNSFSLLHDDMLAEAQQRINEDRQTLAARAPAAPHYVRCEHERQGHYMRNMISQAMMVVQHHRPLYQFFTAPEVYGFMWSLHPVARTNEVYAALLEHLGHDLARMPWARTNRALQGPTEGAQSLPKEFHNYCSWISTDLYDELTRLADPDWFGQTGVFDANAVRQLASAVCADPQGRGKHGHQLHERFVWLAGVRRLAEELQRRGKTLAAPAVDSPLSRPAQQPAPLRLRRALRDLRRSLLNRNVTQPLQRTLVRLRHQVLRRAALRRYPPRPWE